MARCHYHSAICDPNVFILHYTEEDEREMREGGGGWRGRRSDKRWGQRGRERLGWTTDREERERVKKRRLRRKEWMGNEGVMGPRGRLFKEGGQEAGRRDCTGRPAEGLQLGDRQERGHHMEPIRSLASPRLASPSSDKEEEEGKQPRWRQPHKHRANLRRVWNHWEKTNLQDDDTNSSVMTLCHAIRLH